MKTLLVLSALLLSGCSASYQGERAAREANAFCVKADFTPDTPEFRECMLRHYEAGAVRGGGASSQDSSQRLIQQGQELMRQGAPQTRGITCTQMGSITRCY